MQMGSFFQLKVNIFRMNKQKSSHMLCLLKTHLKLGTRHTCKNYNLYVPINITSKYTKQRLIW